jgi:flagellar basal-body rod protein FlgF
MIGGLYTSMAGLETVSERLDTVAQNLANSNTQGYAAVQTAAIALPYKGSHPQAGADVIALNESVNTQAGAMQHTGSPFNVAVTHGWLLVQTANGQQALTRNGQLAQNAQGLLTTSTGEPVLSNGGTPISLPLLKNLTIGADGSVSGVPVTSADNQPQQYGNLFLAQTPPANTLTPLSNSLYGLAPGQKPVIAPNAQVQQGYLEGSNVNTVKSMMDMIDVSRSYQMQTQVMGQNAKTQTELDQIMMA